MILGRAYFALQALAGATWWITVALFPFVRSATLGSLSAPAVAVADVPLFVLASAAAALGLRRAAWVAATWTCIVTAALAAHATLTGEAGWGVLLMAGAAGASVAALSLVVLGHVPTRWLLVGPFAFRPATPRTSARPHVLATGVQILVFWGFFLAVVPLVLRFLEHRWGVSLTVPPVVDLVGVVALVLASGLGIWSAVAMSTTGDGTPLPAAMANRLVIAGPYRWVRNPMAVSGIVQGVAVGLVLSSWLVVVYALLGSMLWNFAIRPHEELDLELRFGDPYRRYRDSVRCWVPRIVRARGAFASVS